MKSLETLASPLLGPRTQEGVNTLVPRKKSQAETDRLADYLADKLGAPDYRPAFLRIAWRLDDGTVHRLAGQALESASNPRAYFIACAKNEMRRRGVA